MQYKISVSQIKTYLKSPAERAGQKILGITGFKGNESTISGNMLHTYMENKVLGKSDKQIEEAVFISLVQLLTDYCSPIGFSMKKGKKFDTIEDICKNCVEIEGLNTLEIFDKYNRAIKSQEQYTPDPYNNPATEVKIDFQFEGIDMTAIIDVLTDDYGIDYKTFATKVEEGKRGGTMFSALSTREEYELQAWIYFYALHSIGKDIQRFKFVLFCNKEYKTYKPEDYHKVIEFIYSDEWNKKMMDRYLPVVQKMVELYEKLDYVREKELLKTETISENDLEFW